MKKLLKKLLCLVRGHDWSATWHGQDWYEYGWKKNYEALNCLRCGHPGIRYENGKRLPLLDNTHALLAASK
jgi:hypothetical protein